MCVCVCVCVCVRARARVWGTLYIQRTEVVFEGHLDMEVLTLASCN